MSDRSTPEQRFVELESALAHAQQDISDLSDVTLRQQAEIEDLKRELNKLTFRVDSVEEDPASRNPADEKPPHY